MELSQTGSDTSDRASAVEQAVARWRRFTSKNMPREADRVAGDIVAALLPTISSQARKIKSAEVSYEELTACGRTAVIKALDRYDPASAAQFATFSLTAARGAMLNYLRDNGGGSIHQPDCAVRRRRKIAKAIEMIEARGEEVNDVNISRETGFPIAQVERTLAELTSTAGRPMRIGTDIAHGEVNPEWDPHFAVDWRADSDTKIALDQCMAGALTLEERVVLNLRFREDLSQRQVAATLEVSQGTVSRIEDRAKTKLSIAFSELNSGKPLSGQIVYSSE